jgi:protein SCO1/2
MPQDQNPSLSHPVRLSRLVWLGLALAGALLVLAFLLATLKSSAGSGKPLPVLGQVADFTLTNQNGRVVSLTDLQGRVWVADIIFTRCAGPCPKMTRQMRDIQAALPADSHARLITLTTDPDFDSPAVLKTYAQRFGADFNSWLFLTGSKKQIAKLAIDSLKLTAIEKTPEERQSPVDLFVHSTIFVAVDKHGRLRAIFETSGEGIDLAQVRDQIIGAVRRLERET